MIYEIEKYNSIYRLEIMQGHPLRMRPYKSGYDKYYPTVTQCLIYEGNLVISKNEVSRHSKDKNDEGFAVRTVVSKAFKNARIGKTLRLLFWGKILKDFPFRSKI